MKKKKIVFLQGAFDILTAGHIRAFRQAKKLGDVLLVALNTDSLLPRYKNRVSVIPYKQRKEILSAIKYIDKIIPISTFGCLHTLKKYKVDIYTITREWEDTHRDEINYMRNSGGRVVFFLHRKGTMTSSEIRNSVINLWKKQNSSKSQR